MSCIMKVNRAAPILIFYSPVISFQKYKTISIQYDEIWCISKVNSCRRFNFTRNMHPLKSATDYALHYVPSNALIMHLQKYLHFIKSAKSAHSPIFLPLQNFLIIYIYMHHSSTKRHGSCMEYILKPSYNISPMAMVLNTGSKARSTKMTQI